MNHSILPFPPPVAPAASPLLAIELEAVPEDALLARITQKMAWIEIAPVRLYLALDHAGTTVRIEILFAAPPDRAQLFFGQLRKLVAVETIGLSSSALIQRTDEAVALARIPFPDRPVLSAKPSRFAVCAGCELPPLEPPARTAPLRADPPL